MSIHDRTELFVRAYVPQEGASSFKFDNVRARISISPKLSESPNGQLMVLTSVNLIARFAKRVNLDIDEGLSRKIFVPSSSSEKFGQSLLEFAKAIDSRLDIALSNQSDERTFSVGIGAQDQSSKFSVCINSDGWLSELRNGNELDYASEKQNPIGAGVAACLAAAEVFKEALRRLGSKTNSVQQSLRRIRFSSLDYSVDSADAPNPTLPTRMDIGRVCLVGAGAVGNSLLYTLRYFSRLAGTITIVDFDKVDQTNLNRYLTATRKDVGRFKVDVGAAFFWNTSVEAIPQRNSYEEYSRIQRSSVPDLLVSTVDNNEGRRQIQSDLPKLILHGATREHTLVVSRHSFLNGACLGCLFSDRPKTFAEQIADDVGIPVEEANFLLSTNGQFTQELMTKIVKARGFNPEMLAKEIGKPFKDVYSSEICGTLKVTVGAKAEAATVSFVSAMAGMLLAGEILKERTPGYENYRLNNYFLMSMFAPWANQPFFREKIEYCSASCSNPIMISRFREKWSGNPIVQSGRTSG